MDTDTDTVRAAVRESLSDGQDDTFIMKFKERQADFLYQQYPTAGL